MKGTSFLMPCALLTPPSRRSHISLHRKTKYRVMNRRRALMLADDSKPSSPLPILSSLISALVDRLDDKDDKKGKVHPSSVAEQAEQQDNAPSSEAETWSLQSLVTAASNALQSFADARNEQNEQEEQNRTDADIRNIALASFLVGLTRGDTKRPDDSQIESNDLKQEKAPSDASDDSDDQFSVVSLFAALGKRVADQVGTDDEIDQATAKETSREENELDEKSSENVHVSSFDMESLLKKGSLLGLPSMLSAFLARARTQETDGDFPKIAPAVEERNVNGTDLVKGGSIEELQSGKPPSPVLRSLLSALGTQIEDVTASNINNLRQRLDDASDLPQQALVATMRALGVEPFDRDAKELDNLPKRPLDPLLALILAGYSFRAYDNPPKHGYRESFDTVVKASAVSGLKDQIIHTEFVYTDASIVSQRANGLFLIDFLGADELDGRFVTASINESVILDVLDKKACSILRQNDAHDSHQLSLLHRKVDEIELQLYTDKQAHKEGRAPTHIGSVSVASLVNRAFESGTQADMKKFVITLEEVSEDERNRDFFQFSLLPRELKNPFRAHAESQRTNSQKVLTPNITILGGIVELGVSFIPFTKESNEELKEKGTLSTLKDAVSKAFASMSTKREDPQINTILDHQLAPGALPAPADWTRLASVARSLLDDRGAALPISRTSTLPENLPGALFIQSHATDTEVWLFRDEKSKNVVISFRGTEQVSWRDFFTDAQLFLQRWTPGEEINLNVDLSNTVGLADLLPSILPNQESNIPDNAPAVHYGFLQAYLSVREAVLKGIRMLTDDLCSDYSLHFTGHSLGGALATIAASDFAARNLFDGREMCCMSFGAPKVGNVFFARLYNELVPNSFRIVNDTDLVVRMPRSVASNSALSRYSHAGRTVLVNDEGEYWIEGGGQMMGSFADPIRERYKNLKDLMEFEQSLWEQLMCGRSVQNHMEDSYFVAMQRVLKKFKADHIV